MKTLKEMRESLFGKLLDRCFEPEDAKSIVEGVFGGYSEPNTELNIGIYRDGDEIRLNIVDYNSSMLVTFATEKEFEDFVKVVNDAEKEILGVDREGEETMTSLPKAVCLVGSTKPKWKKQYRHVEEELTKRGFVVLSVVWFKDELPDFESHRELLERIHFQKIRLSDFVVLIHKDAVGKHTRMEMEFAKAIGKRVITFSDMIEKGNKHDEKERKQ